MIIGSCGAVGSSFIRKVIYEINQNKDKYPYKIVSIDRMNGSGNRAYINKNHRFYPADIRDQHIISTIFKIEQPDIVIHAVDEYSDNIESMQCTNVLGTQVIINACVEQKVRKLIYVSTDKVYAGQTNDQQPVWTEESLLAPATAYGISKIAGEQLVLAAQKDHGLIYNIVRGSNNYGPWQNSERLVPKIIKSVLNEQKFSLYGQGLQLRDWIHVYDFCSALLTILTQGENNADI